MSYTYARIGAELWGSRSIGESTQRQVDNIQSKRRVSHYFFKELLKKIKYKNKM